MSFSGVPFPTSGLIPSWPRSQILWKLAPSPAKHSEWGPRPAPSTGFLTTNKKPCLSSIFLKKGQTLGIVGLTGKRPCSSSFAGAGCGCGFDLPDGHDIRNYRLQDLRVLMGYVPQDQILFAMSIRDNIRFANPDISDDLVKKAAQLVVSMRTLRPCQKGWTPSSESGVSPYLVVS